MCGIYKTIDETQKYFRKILPKFTSIELIFVDTEYDKDVQQVNFRVKIPKTKFIIDLEINEYKNKISYDCRVVSEKYTESEFDHSNMTLYETIDTAYNWIKNNKEQK